MRRNRLVSVAALAFVAVTAAACGSGDSADGDGANIVDEPDNGAETAADDDSDAAAGTRQNPVAPGTTFTVGDWTVEFAETNTDADDVVADENEFNEPPADGRRFVLAEVTVTYTGDESGDPMVDLSFSFYGSDGNTFGGTDADDYCGVVPDGLENEGEMFPDASATGNICTSVPTEQIEDGAWIVESTWDPDSDRTFVALG